MGRLRKKPWAEKYLEESKYVVNNPSDFKGKWNKHFGNDNPIHIEIGMGKGKFLLELATNNPKVNYIGIEKFPSVLVVPTKELEERKLDNVKLISGDAEQLIEWFENESIDKIYLNFSDPWPKDRHAKRRLVYRKFLDVYHSLLKNGSYCEFKTDQKPLFEFAMDEIENESSFTIETISNDLHKEESNVITTEYEERFIKLNNPIYFIRIKK